MTHAQVTATFSEELHPRADDGKFGSGSGGAGTTPRKAAKTTPRRRARRHVPSGQLGFDGVHGTGYGMPYGDKRVRELQEQSNRLGLTDARGRPLVVDGRLGPLTTQSIKAAQVRLGMKPTGIIAPAFIERLKASKALPPAKKAAPRKRVKAKFNPDQLRDPDGTWGDGIPRPGGAVSDALKLAGRIDLKDDEQLAASGRLNSDSGTGIDVVWAAVDSPRGREIRIGTVYDDDAGKWRAADKGATASLSASDAAGLRDDLAEADVKAKAAAKQADAIYASGGQPTDGPLLGTQAVAEGRVASNWGGLSWDAYLTDDDPTSYQLELTASADESADPVQLDPGEVRKLVKQLGDLASDGSKPVTAAEMRGIELARPGKWNLASGPMEITDRHITDAARHAQRAGARPGYVKIGHTDKRFIAGDGEPALGWVENVRREVDAKGPKLVGDLLDMPEWFAAAARKHWPYRSIEGWADYTDPDTGEKYALVVDGVAVLGVTPPGMTSLQSLRDLPPVVASASGTRVVASFASAPVAEKPTDKEAGHMNVDPVKFREALGLSADASVDEVRTALAATDFTPESPPAAPVQASLFGEEQPVKPKPPTVAPGTMVIASSIWDETQKTIKTLSEFVSASKRDKRDEVIAQAVKAGKFTPAQRPNFVKLWDADPDGTQALIESLTPNSQLAVMASGYADGVAQEEDELDREIARLSRPEVRNG